MQQIERALATLLALGIAFYEMVLSFLEQIERWFHVQLQPLHLPREAETVVLLFAFLLIGLAIARLLAGLLRLVLLLTVIALAADILVPALQR